MSLAEILEGVKSLTLDEKQQLYDTVSEDLEKSQGISPDWFKPGAVYYPGTHLTVDQAGFDSFLEAYGMKAAE
jgi:hypothetical protein